MKYRARVKGLLVLVLCSAVPFLIHARESPVGILEYLDDPLESRILLSDGTEIEPVIGLELEGGMIVQTFTTTAEIRLASNGSILRLAEHSIFRLEGVRIRETEQVNAFSLAAGTLRCVAARVSGQGYAVHTPSAVLGIRGTDFIIDAASGREILRVLDGMVEILFRTTGRMLPVEAGLSADLENEEAKPKVFDEDVRDLLVRMNSFRFLDPEQVVHQEGFTPSTFDLSREAEEVTADDLGDLLERCKGTEEDGGRTTSDASGKGPATGKPRSRDAAVWRAGRDGAAGPGAWAFVLSAGLYPELALIAESTWTNLLSGGFGGSMSVTAGPADDPEFFGGFTAGVYSLGGKADGGPETALWVPVGLCVGIRRDLVLPLALFTAAEGGMQYSRFSYEIESQPVIEGWVPYVLARLGLRYGMDPLVLEAGAAFGSVFDGSAVPFVRIFLGILYEVEL